MKWGLALLLAVLAVYTACADASYDAKNTTHTTPTTRTTPTTSTIHTTSTMHTTEANGTRPERRNFHQALRSYRHIGDAIGQAAAEWMTKDGGVWKTLQKDLPSINISEPCMSSLVAVFMHLQDFHHIPEWAIRFLDAQPKPPSSILEGNIAWLGGFHQCMNLTAYANVSDPTPASKILEGKYCLVTINVTDPAPSQHAFRKASPLMEIPKALRLGLCAPDTCTRDDVASIVQLAIYYLEANFSSAVKENLSITDVRCPVKEIPLDAGAVTVIVLLLAFGTLVLVGTIYDVLSNTSEERLVVESTHYTTLLPSADVSDPSDPYVKDVDARNGRSLFGRVCMCLSAVANTRRMFRTDRGVSVVGVDRGVGVVGVMGELAWIDALRVLSMVWIILGQSYALGLPMFNNLLMLPEAMKGLFTQIIIQSTFAVDTFLFLSGFLVAYRFLGELVGGFDCYRLIRFYVNRYLRLFPVYMIVLGVYAALTKYISSGPFWPQDEAMLGNCSHLAWTNAFYINNYVQPDQMCMPWTYYIAIDFQLFAFAPLIVLTLWAMWQAGVALCGVCILAAVVAAGVISKVMQLPPSLVGFGSTDISAFDQDLTMRYFTDYLITAHCRAAPYFIGILAAFFLRDTPNVQRPSLMTVCLGWTAALIGLCVVVFGLVGGFNGHPLSVDEAAAFNSLSHVLWGVCLCWIAYSCMTRAVRGVDRVLGWSMWRPLSAISYSVYLVAPIMICAYYLSREESVRFTHWNILVVFAGNLLLSLLMGFLVYILIEAPVRSLVRMLLRRSVVRTPVEQNGTDKI